MTAAEKFQNITRYNITEYFERVVTFIETLFPKLQNYYKGGELDAAAFSSLDNLLVESQKVSAIFEMNGDYLQTVDMWDLLDLFSDSLEKLNTANNLARWMKSSRSRGYTDVLVIEQLLKSGESFETFEFNNESLEPQNSWVDTTVNNLITEEDYTPEGGVKFNSTFQDAGATSIQSVVDVLSGDNILGKDLSKDFTFTYTTNNGRVYLDLTNVTGMKAIEQAYGILVGLVAGDIPEDPSFGLPNDLVGSDVIAIQYPIIFRALIDMFSTDNRWKNLTILGVETQEDAAFIRIQVSTILGDQIITNVSI